VGRKTLTQPINPSERGRRGANSLYYLHAESGVVR